MRDYRQHLGREINVVDQKDEGFQGRLVDVGRDSITIEVTKHVQSDGEVAPKTPAGHLMIASRAIRFVQVL